MAEIDCKEKEETNSATHSLYSCFTDHSVVDVVSELLHTHPHTTHRQTPIIPGPSKSTSGSRDKHSPMIVPYVRERRRGREVRNKRENERKEMGGRGCGGGVGEKRSRGGQRKKGRKVGRYTRHAESSRSICGSLCRGTEKPYTHECTPSRFAQQRPFQNMHSSNLYLTYLTKAPDATYTAPFRPCSSPGRT